MTAVWRVGVLRPGVENVVCVAEGVATALDTAFLAATDVVLDVAVAEGRAEYRLVVGDREVIVIPGVAPDGTVDLPELRAALDRLVRPIW